MQVYNTSVQMPARKRQGRLKSLAGQSKACFSARAMQCLICHNLQIPDIQTVYQNT
jgi:hypothetical protein